MLTSILHRMTGVALGAGLILLAWWLAATAAGPGAYATFAALAGHWAGRLVLFGFTLALMFHALNGIRHLVWDTGRGFHVPTAERSGLAVLVASVVLTFLVWAAAYCAMGAFQ